MSFSRDNNWGCSNMNDNEVSNNLAISDAYQCHKCGESRTQSIQMQTRSADEPITTFIRCLICGNCWRI